MYEKLKYSLFIFLLTVGISNAAQASSGNAQPDASTGILYSKEMVRDIAREYNELFLRPPEQFLLAGDMTAAGTWISQFRKDIRKLCSKLITGADEKYYESLGKIEKTSNEDRFHPNSFRSFNPAALIENIDKEKESLDHVFSKHSREAEKIKEKAENRVPNREELQKQFKSRYQRFMNAWKDKIVDNIPDDRTDILSIIKPIQIFMDGLSEEDFLQEPNAQNLFKTKAQNLFKTAEHMLIDTHNKSPDDILSLDLGCILEGINNLTLGYLIEFGGRLAGIDAGEIYYPEEKEDLDIFERISEDYQRRMRREEKKLEFLENFRPFVEIGEKDRLSAIGEDNILHDDISWGDNVVTGVIESCEYYPGSALSSQFINPENNPESKSKNDDIKHAFHVAGIIVSQQISEKDNLLLGIAPQARCHMINASDLSGVCVSDKDECANEHLLQENCDVSGHKALLDLFCNKEEGSAYFPHFKGFKAIEWNRQEATEGNMVHGSPAKLFNVSLGGKGIQSEPELWNILWSVSLRPDALFCIGLANDGIMIDSSPRVGRALRALAEDEGTQNNVIFATNLMRDGMTLSPLSNVPGDHLELKKRTLSAVGTDVESTFFQGDERCSKDRGLMSGTSQATPKVAGAASVVLSNNPNLTHDQLAECLLKGATPLLYDQDYMTMIELTGYTAGQLDLAFDENPGGIDLSTEEFITSSSFYQPSHIHIDLNLWEESQNLFGRGRVNIKGALDYADEFFAVGG